MKALLKLTFVLLGSLVALLVLVVRPRLLDTFSPSHKILFDRFAKNSRR